MATFDSNTGRIDQLVYPVTWGDGTYSFARIAYRLHDALPDRIDPVLKVCR